MAFAIHTLPAGTSVHKVVNLPTSGDWQGLVKASLATTDSNASIAEWLFIYPNNPDGKIRYRRTGGTVASPVANSFKNWTLTPQQRITRWLTAGENLMTIRYTSTQDISLSIETTRSITPYHPYPAIPASSGAANAIIMPDNTVHSVLYWDTV